MRKLFVATLAIAALAAGSALAADLPAKPPVYKAPPPPPAAYDWSGFYIGGEVGALWGHANGSFVNPPLATFSVDRTTGAGGGFIGYQQQFNSVVIGVEANVIALFQQNLGASLCNPLASCAAGFTQATSFNNPIWTVGARLGWSAGMWMPYVTGGYAGTRIHQTFLNAAGVPFNNLTQDRNGWYIGGGVDWAVGSNWIIGAEYRHYDFGSKTGVPTLAGGGLDPADTVNLRVRADTAMLRASYKFGGPIGARY